MREEKDPCDGRAGVKGKDGQKIDVCALCKEKYATQKIK